MSTIERAAARLGSISRSAGAELPFETGDPATLPVSGQGTAARVDVDSQRASGSPFLQAPVGGRFVEIDLDALTARGFATPANAKTPLAVEFRRIKRPLLLKVKQTQVTAEDQNPPNLIMVTSSVPHEGKTFVAANLAMSIAAEVDLSVVLVDADVTKGDVTRVLGLDNEYGLSDVVQRGAAYVEDAIIQTNFEHLSILPAGRPNPTIDEYFASEEMLGVTRALALKDPHRIIVFDAAPLLAATEARVLARLVGQVVLVVEADKTPQAKVNDAIEHLEGCASVSLLLNKVTRRSKDAYYNYGYGYGAGA